MNILMEKTPLAMNILMKMNRLVELSVPVFLCLGDYDIY
jgi:hypothetical protein